MKIIVIMLVVLVVLAVVAAMPVTFCVLFLVTLLAEPIRHRRQVRTQLWQALNRVTTRKLKAAIQDELVHKQMVILHWQLRPGYE